MNYSLIYENLVLKRKHHPVIDGYAENHHIVPKCMGGTDTIDNIIRLTAREHFVAHWLLAKIYNGTVVGYKLSSAFQLMTRDSNHEHRYKCTSRVFEIARILFSENHPCKNDSVREKIRNTILNKPENIEKRKKTPQKLITPRHIIEERKKLASVRKLIQALRKLQRNKKLQSVVKIEKQKQIPVKKVTKMCPCGCNRNFEVTINNTTKKYYDKSCVNSEYHRHLLSEIHRKRLSKMTTEELSDRSKNSWGACDHTERGRKISAGKRGRAAATQNELEIQKYGIMEESEFLDFIKDRIPKIRTRMINKRKLYNERNTRNNT